MDDNVCKICNNKAKERLVKQKVRYYQCTNCQTLFCHPLDNSGMVGGGNEESRNQQQNQGRLDRIARMLGGHKDIPVLDFGCGHGLLVQDLKDAEFIADGYDLYNDAFNKQLPPRNTYGVVTAVEVIEHTSYPFFEIDVIYRSLRRGGALYVETSFVDIAIQEKIPLEDFFYIDPSVGHSTIFSYHGMDVLMISKGFRIAQHFNRNVRIYHKP
jgi:2-polyprenyl-3-methyl-5-hydroxy-6-metoxy-1,4-benzoquinol methylase